MSCQVIDVSYMCSFKRAYVPRFTLSLLCSFHVTVLNLHSLGHICRQEVDPLARVVEYFEFKLLHDVKVHSNFLVCEMSELTYYGLFVVCCGFFRSLSYHRHYFPGVCKQEHPCNMSGSCSRAVWSVGERADVCAQGGLCRAGGFGCSLLCKQHACVWIRLLRKVNLPSWFGETTYWLT